MVQVSRSGGGGATSCENGGAQPSPAGTTYSGTPLGVALARLHALRLDPIPSALATNGNGTESVSSGYSRTAAVDPLLAAKAGGAGVPSFARPVVAPNMSAAALRTIPDARQRGVAMGAGSLMRTGSVTLSDSGNMPGILLASRGSGRNNIADAMGGLATLAHYISDNKWAAFIDHIQARPDDAKLADPRTGRPLLYHAIDLHRNDFAHFLLDAYDSDLDCPSSDLVAELIADPASITKSATATPADTARLSLQSDAHRSSIIDRTVGKAGMGAQSVAPKDVAAVDTQLSTSDGHGDLLLLHGAQGHLADLGTFMGELARHADNGSRASAALEAMPPAAEGQAMPMSVQSEATLAEASSVSSLDAAGRLSPTEVGRMATSLVVSPDGNLAISSSGSGKLPNGKKMLTDSPNHEDPETLPKDGPSRPSTPPPVAPQPKVSSMIPVRDYEGNSPLLTATRAKNLDVVEAILRKWPRALQVANVHGMTPLLAACEVGSEALVGMFLKLGANLSHTDNDGNTALHVAASYNHFGVVAQLVANGANFMARNHKMWTALDYAYSETLQAFLQDLERDVVLGDESNQLMGLSEEAAARAAAAAAAAAAQAGHPISIMMPTGKAALSSSSPTSSGAVSPLVGIPSGIGSSTSLSRHSTPTQSPVTRARMITPVAMPAQQHELISHELMTHGHLDPPSLPSASSTALPQALGRPPGGKLLGHLRNPSSGAKADKSLRSSLSHGAKAAFRAIRSGGSHLSSSAQSKTSISSSSSSGLSGIAPIKSAMPQSPGAASHVSQRRQSGSSLRSSSNLAPSVYSVGGKSVSSSPSLNESVLASSVATAGNGAVGDAASATGVPAPTTDTISASLMASYSNASNVQAIAPFAASGTATGNPATAGGAELASSPAPSGVLESASASGGTPTTSQAQSTDALGLPAMAQLKSYNQFLE